MKQSILITRPKDQAQRIVQHLENSGFRVFIEPTFSVKKIDLKNSVLLKNFTDKKVQAIILTSGNAAEVAFEAVDLLGFEKDLKIFAVGKKPPKYSLIMALKILSFPKKILRKI